MARLTSTTLAGATLALMIAASPASAHQPGEVSCYKPDSRTAHAVCASPRLSRADQRMNRLFDEARDATETRYQVKDLHETQRIFVAKRNRCGSSRFCIWWRTKQRIRQLNRFIRHI